MLMFSFMLCSFKRKSNLGFSCSPDHFGKLLSFIYSFKIWKFGHQIILVKWYPSYKYVLIWDMKTSSPGHVEAELVAKYLINFIDIQDLDQVNLEKNILEKNSQNLKAYPDLYWNLFKGSLLVNCERRIVRRVVVGQHHKLRGFFTTCQSNWLNWAHQLLHQVVHRPGSLPRRRNQSNQGTGHTLGWVWLERYILLQKCQYLNRLMQHHQ